MSPIAKGLITLTNDKVSTPANDWIRPDVIARIETDIAKNPIGIQRFV